MGEKVENFRSFREKLNKKILDSGNMSMKRFFNLDNRVYEDGVLDSRTKEMLGLVASMVLRCDDCITHHIIRCQEEGLSREEFFEVLNIALIVGGSIVIPHLRRAVELLEELENNDNQSEGISDNDNKADKNDIVIDIYTDGSCDGNPGPGGYAAVIMSGNNEKQISGFKPDTTNNRMELTAVIEGLKIVDPGSKVRIFSDSNYVIKGITQWIEGWKQRGWKTAGKKLVKNKDLWQKLDILTEEYNVEFVKVKAHSGDKYNELVDSLAKQEIEKGLEEH